MLWPLYVALYPIAGLAAGAAMIAAILLLQGVLPPQPGMPFNVFVWLIALAASGAAAVVVTRFVESRLAQNAAFRIARHVLRLALFGGMTLIVIQKATGIPSDTTMGVDFIKASATPINLAIVLGVVVGMHFLLWKGEGFRSFWHRRLEAVGARKEEVADLQTEPADLPIKPIWD